MKGIYVLIVQVSNDVTVHVGALGELIFEEGLYSYVGSAQSNLEERVRRHLGNEKRKFWHIDYLLANPEAKVLRVFYKEADKIEECAVARVIGERGRGVVGFGASDCNCRSHLFRIKDFGFLKKFMCALHVET